MYVVKSGSQELLYETAKNCALRFDDRVAGECEGAKGPPRVKLMSQKWLQSAIFSILRNSKCVGQIAKKFRRDFFGKLKKRLL